MIPEGRPPDPAPHPPSFTGVPPLPNFAPPSSPFNSILDERSHSIAIFAFFFRYFSSTRPNEFFPNSGVLYPLVSTVGFAITCGQHAMCRSLLTDNVGCVGLRHHPGCLSRCRWRIDEPAPSNTHFATDHRDGCVHVGHGYNKISGFRENSNRLIVLNGLQVIFRSAHGTA